MWTPVSILIHCRLVTGLVLKLRIGFMKPLCCCHFLSAFKHQNKTRHSNAGVASVQRCRQDKHRVKTNTHTAALRQIWNQKPGRGLGLIRRLESWGKAQPFGCSAAPQYSSSTTSPNTHQVARRRRFDIVLAQKLTLWTSNTKLCYWNCDPHLALSVRGFVKLINGCVNLIWTKASFCFYFFLFFLPPDWQCEAPEREFLCPAVQ